MLVVFCLAMLPESACIVAFPFQVDMLDFLFNCGKYISNSNDVSLEKN